jgi:hypothetical protein
VNFSSKGSHGYPNAYSEEWLVWTHRVNDLAGKIGQSSITNSIARGLGMDLLSQDTDHFESAKGLIVSGLRAAQRIYGEPIPASDRTVSLGHNSPEKKQALEKIDELVEAVKEANDLPGSPEDKEPVLAELSAGRKLLEASTVRLDALRATVQPALRWILEKAAGTIVGRLQVASGIFSPVFIGFRGVAPPRL